MNHGIRLFALSSLLAIGSAQASTVFMDVTGITPGGSDVGAFTGTLNGVAISAQLSGLGSHTALFGVDTNLWGSTLDGSSPQFHSSSIYAPALARGDRVGYTNDVDRSYAGTRLTINFAQTMSNLVFHIANLDGTVFDFSATSGLTGIGLLKGNGDGNEGLGVSGKALFDFNPDTIVGQAPEDVPFHNGEDRSAYGSVLLAGSYSSLVIDIATNPQVTLWQHSLDGAADGGSFTLSTTAVPLPSAAWLFGSVLGAGLMRRQKSGEQAFEVVNTD